MLSKKVSTGYDTLARVKAAATAQGYDYHQIPTTDMEHFELKIFTLTPYKLIQTIPFMASMEERPSVVAAEIMEKRLPTLTSHTAPAPTPISWENSIQIGMFT